MAGYYYCYCRSSCVPQHCLKELKLGLKVMIKKAAMKNEPEVNFINDSF